MKYLYDQDLIHEIHTLTRILHIHHSLLNNSAYMDCDPRRSGTVGSESDDGNPQAMKLGHSIFGDVSVSDTYQTLTPVRHSYNTY